MNRRSFLQLSATAAVAELAGCTVDPRALLRTVVQCANAIVKVAGPSSASWLPDFQAAIKQLEDAIAKWIAGGSKDLVGAALTALENMLAKIPTGDVVAPLIAILVAALDAAWKALFPGATQAGLAPNPYQGKVHLHHSPFEPLQDSLRHQWDETAEAHHLQAAEI